MLLLLLRLSLLCLLLLLLLLLLCLLLLQLLMSHHAERNVILIIRVVKEWFGQCVAEGEGHPATKHAKVVAHVGHGLAETSATAMEHGGGGGGSGIVVVGKHPPAFRAGQPTAGRRARAR